MMRPTPNHETLRLPNDDDDGCMNPPNVPTCSGQRLHAFILSENISLLKRGCIEFRHHVALQFEH